MTFQSYKTKSKTKNKIKIRERCNVCDDYNVYLQWQSNSVFIKQHLYAALLRK